jgi:hypothetical protein
VVCPFQALVYAFIIFIMAGLLDGSSEVARQFCHLISYEDLGQ